MTDSRPDQDALVTAENMTAGMQELAGEVKKLRKSQRRSWKVVLFDIVLTVALAVVSIVALHASQDANTAREAAATARATAAAEHAGLAAQHASLIASCQSANVTRAEEVGLWEHLASVSTPSPGETKTQIAKNAAAVAAFLRYVRAVFAPKNCAQVYKGG